MITSNFDLYKAEWLDLVFDKRNKEYGAYELRQHYARNMAMAMLITFSAIGATLITLNIVFKHDIVPNQRIIEIPLTPPPPIETAKKPIVPIPPAQHVQLPPSPPVRTIEFKPMVVVPGDVPTDPPTRVELQTAAVGPKTTEGAPGGTSTLDVPAGPGGDAPAITEDKTIFNTVEVMPEPVGGMEAFNKFLSRNLRYPDGSEAQGRVILTFVIEKDGSITAIQVLRSIAPELDAEAIRVLKKAPKWKPGIQNGRPVRVQYTIPFNFTQAEGN